MIRAMIFLQLLSLPLALAEVEDKDLYVSLEAGYAPGSDVGFNVTDSSLGDRGGFSGLDDSDRNYSLGLGGTVRNIRIEGRVFWIAYDISTVEYTYFDSPTTTLRELNESVTLAGEAEGEGVELGIYYDFSRGIKWVPYIGGGVGKARMEFSYAGMSVVGRHIAFAQEYTPVTLFVRGGVTYRISPRAKLDLSYTLRSFGDDHVFQEVDNNSRLESESYESSHVSFGLRYRVGGGRQ